MTMQPCPHSASPSLWLLSRLSRIPVAPLGAGIIWHLLDI
jgi:hypothetical protein